MISVFCNRRSHARLSRAGKVVAAICFVHCLLFLLLFASFTFFAVAPSNQWIHWFDNAYLHLGFGGAAVALAATHMVLHKESLSKRALLLALFGAGCLTVSVSGEFVLHSHAHTHSSGAGDHVHVHEDGTVCTDPHHHAQPSGSGSVLASADGEHSSSGYRARMYELGCPRATPLYGIVFLYGSERIGRVLRAEKASRTRRILAFE